MNVYFWMNCFQVFFINWKSNNWSCLVLLIRPVISLCPSLNSYWIVAVTVCLWHTADSKKLVLTADVWTHSTKWMVLGHYLKGFLWGCIWVAANWAFLWFYSNSWMLLQSGFWQRSHGELPGVAAVICLVVGLPVLVQLVMCFFF